MTLEGHKTDLAASGEEAEQGWSVHHWGFPVSGLPALPNMRIGSKSYEQPLFYIKQDLIYMNIMVLVPKPEAVNRLYWY